MTKRFGGVRYQLMWVVAMIGLCFGVLDALLWAYMLLFDGSDTVLNRPKIVVLFVSTLVLTAVCVGLATFARRRMRTTL
jgi:hypothetical protein